MLITWTICCAMLAMLFGVARLAVYLASRTRLRAALKARGREGRIDWFDRHQREYRIICLILQMTLSVALVILIDRHYEASPLMEQARGRALRPFAVFLLSSATLLILGAAIPSAAARYHGEHILARLLGFIEGLRRAMFPMLWLVDLIDEIVRRLAGAPRESEDETEQFELDILDAVSHAQRTGAMHEAERSIIQSALNLDETAAGEIMTPRTDMVAVPRGAGFEQVRDLVLAAGHSRIPVYEGSLDHVVGVIYAKDLLAVSDPKQFSIDRLMRSVPFVPETKDLAALLKEFQAGRVHIAIVLDEYGGTAGLVTIEDVLEELVGEIADEYEPSPPAPIQRIDAHTAEVDARVRIDELNTALELHLPEDEAYDTVGGFVFSRMGRIPVRGESLEEDRVRIEILDAGDRQINRVRVRAPHVAQEAG